MNFIRFIVRDGSGKPLRSGLCRAEDMSLQAATGEVVAEATPAEIEAHRASTAAVFEQAASFKDQEVSPVEALLEVLKGRGIDVRQADLEAAAVSLQARRRGAVKGGK